MVPALNQVRKHKEDGPKHVNHHDDSFIDRIIDDFGKAVGFITLTGLLSGLVSIC